MHASQRTTYFTVCAFSCCVGPGRSFGSQVCSSVQTAYNIRNVFLRTNSVNMLEMRSSISIPYHIANGAQADDGVPQMGRRSNVQSGDVIYNHTPYTLATADEDRNTPAATATATADADADAPLYQTMDRTRNHTRSSSGTSYHCIPFLPLFSFPPK